MTLLFADLPAADADVDAGDTDIFSHADDDADAYDDAIAGDAYAYP